MGPFKMYFCFGEQSRRNIFSYISIKNQTTNFWIWQA